MTKFKPGVSESFLLNYGLYPFWGLQTDKNKYMKKSLFYIPFLLFTLFSINGFAQVDTAKKESDHPLLDKYYPQPKIAPVAKNPVIKSTGVEQKNVMATPKLKPQPIAEKRLTFPTPTPSLTPTPVNLPEIVSAPVKRDSVAIEIEKPVITPVSKGIAITDTKLAIPGSDSAKIVKPVIAIATATPTPAQKPSKVEAGYQRNRLGSSSPLYNTYEKNANGAGSVTTLPKR